MPEYKPRQRTRVRCSDCGYEYDTWWTPIETLYSDVKPEDLASTRVVVCPHCGQRDHIGRNLALYGDLFRETTPQDSWGAGATPDELRTYMAALESQLRASPEWTVDSFRLSDRDGAPMVEVVFIDGRVPGVGFGYRSHIWDPGPVVWWANFMEDTEACPAWALAHDERPSDIVWIAP